MSKALSALLFVIITVTCNLAYADNYSWGSSYQGSKPSAENISVDTDAFDNNLSSADDTVQKALDTLDDMVGGGGGSGDITSVGDVASGAAFDGTQGTTLTFNNAGGDGVLDYDGTDFGMTKPLDVTGTGTFSGNITGAIIQSRRASGLTNYAWYSTTNAAEEWVSYLSGEDMRWFEQGGGGDRFTMEKGGDFGVNDTTPDAKIEILQGSDVEAQGLQITRSNDADYTRLYKKAALGSLNDPVIFSTNSASDSAAIGRDGSGYFAGNLWVGTNTGNRRFEVVSTGSTTPMARLSAGSAGWGRVLELYDSSGSYYNWIMGAQNNISNGVEFTPSTALGGTTYSTPSWSIFTTSVRAGDATNGTTISTTTGITYAGTARPTATIDIPVNAGGCTINNGCADPVKTATATNKINYYTASFAADADDFWQYEFTLPGNYDGGTFTAKIVWTGTTEASATVVWGIQGVCVSDDDADDTAFGTAQTVSDDVTVTGDVQTTSESSAITFGNTPTAGDICTVQVYRDPDNASDDATNPAKLRRVKLTYTRISESTND